MNAIDKSELSEREFSDVLDDLYGDVEICGQTFSSGQALRELDPTAFRCAKNDYEDANQKWECGECSHEFDNEDDANECCKVEEEAAQ